jgi:hypothetical protein
MAVNAVSLRRVPAPASVESRLRFGARQLPLPGIAPHDEGGPEMGRLALKLATAAALAVLALAPNDRADAQAQIAVTCGGAIQKCPEGKKGYCNRWRPCKGKRPKVSKYCDAPVCMTERKTKD